MPSMRAASPQATWFPARGDLLSYFEAHGVKAGGLFTTQNTGAGIRARLFIFYGAGDNIAAWVSVVNSLPPWLDVALFESPGHGFRKGEQQLDSIAEVARTAFRELADTLQEHAAGGSLEGAPFALLGHSLGAQVMIEVALLAKRRLGLEPLCLFPMDRGAPHIHLYTDEGYRLLCMDEPQDFFDGFNPFVGKLMREPARHKPGTDHERQIRMWQRDLQNAQEHHWELGHHIFRCPVHPLCAEENFALDAVAAAGQLKSVPDEVQRSHTLNCKITNAGKASSSPFSRESYAEWRHWTTESCRCHWIQAGHVTIKTHADTAKVVADVISEALEHL